MIPLTHRPVSGPRPARGFTLIELMITLTVLAVVVIALATVIYSAARSKASTSNGVESVQGARVAMDMLARDLRSAGYGADLDYAATPQPPIAYIDSMQVLITQNLQPFPDTTGGGPRYPLAYNPASDPKPHPLNATAWTPPIRYRTGAEVVRWTLDVNNDGVVNAADLLDDDADDAEHTPNPNDFELVREVYGDSSGGAAGSNGGTTERVALVRQPGNKVPPMFTVYLKGMSTPWNWASGPLPAAQLDNIARIVVQITAPSGKPDWRGNYAETSFRTEVNSLRNKPDFGADLFGVDGYVYEDVNTNGTRDSGEPGVPGATVRLGNYSLVTPSNGYFVFHAPAGTYKMWHTPATGYAKLQNPDTVTVTVTAPYSHDFPDKALNGGVVSAFVFDDLDNDGVQDTGEGGHGSVKLTVDPGNTSKYTSVLGTATLWANSGAFTVTATAPDSYLVTTTNPYSGTMAAGDSAAIVFGVFKAPVGKVTGTVYRDNNRNGTMDAGETGIENVWIGITPDGGVTVPGFQYTDASGQFGITVPINDPPHTTPYSIMCIPPNGYFPTTGTSIGSVWLQDGQTITGQNFGMASFQIITLNASRVLSLGSVDMVEKDYTGTISKAKADADIVLGADASGTDQITVWFNQWNAATLFKTTFTSTSDGYSRSAPASVLSLALDFLDTTSPERPDLVTGTSGTASGNFFVWFAQNSSGNEGFFKSAYDPGQNYKTNDNGDVQATLTLDCAGGASADKHDIIVGTKSPTANQGTIEVWKSNNAATPTFTREEIFSLIGATLIGEVTAMATADFDHDGLTDLAVATRTGSYSGQVLFFKGANKSTTPHFTFQTGQIFSGDAFTALTVVDVDGDGWKDVVLGSQTGLTTGKLRYLRNYTSVNPSLTMINVRTVDAPGIVAALGSADFGGSTSRNDLAVGYRTSTTGYVGGVRIYFLDSGTLPSSGTDPSAGAVTNFVPAVTTNNFNFGANPSATAPFYPDLAVGVKITASTGALVVFIR